MWSARQACHKFLDYFQSDIDFGPIFAYPGKAMELYGWKPFKWPGHGLDDDVMYQYMDGEFMTADEYDEFVYDPSGFMLGKWAPRQFTSMEGFAQTIPWQRFMWSGWMNLNFFWLTPEFQKSLRDIQAGAEEAQLWWNSQFQYWGEAKEKGFPMAFAAWDWPPFDIIGTRCAGRATSWPTCAAGRASSTMRSRSRPDLHRIRLRRSGCADPVHLDVGPQVDRASSCRMRSSRNSIGRI